MVPLRPVAGYIGCFCVLFVAILGIVNAQQGSSDGSEADDPTSPHRNPSKCEVCKIVAIELQGAMEDTGKNREILRLGHDFDKEHKKIPYKFSELRFIETLETICERIMEYNIHAERKDSRRFAKGRSETFSTLHGLVNKGVKVDLGIPYNMWDEPSAPVHTMRKYCDTIIEGNEEIIEQWFRGDQEKTLTEYLCRERALTKEEGECLDEVWTGTEKVEYPSAEDQKEDGEKGDTGDDPDKEAAEADSQKIVQKEIERQAEEQRQKAGSSEKQDKERERDEKKRKREEERRRRATEDREGDKKMEQERNDKRKVEREIQRQAEREKRNRDRHGAGEDRHERKRRDRDYEREHRRRRDGRFHDMDFDMDPEERMDRYMDDEMEDIRRRYDLDDDDLGGRYRERDRRRREEREERRRRHRNEL